VSHPREHEELLERVACGALERSDSRVRAVALACAQCRGELDELFESLGAAEGAGRLQRAVLEEARASRGAADAGWARRTLEQRGRLPASRARRAPWLALAGAAAALVALAFLWRSRHEPDSVLLGDGLELERPVGASDDLTVFSWRFELPPKGYFELQVWEHGPDGDEHLLFEQPHLETKTWRAPPESIGSVRSIRWSVDAFDAAGELMDSAGELAELSSH